jgi:hypothetical protein
MPASLPRLAATLAAAALAGCGDPASQGTSWQPLPGEPVTVTPIPLGARGVVVLWWSGYASPARLVIRDEAAWEEAWATLYAGWSPVPPLPEIDFDVETVIVAALGERRTCGFVPAISEASVDGSELLVAVRETVPGDRCYVCQALTFPAVASRLPRLDLPITFVERQAVHDCE